jgi:glycosyltransferase involved in cell wall biosynthesis
VAPLKVGLNLLYLVRGAGGAGTYARELMPALLEVEPKTEVTAFTTHRVPEDALIEGVEWVRYEVEPASRRALWTQHVEIPREAGRCGLDLVHSPANIGIVAMRRAANVVTALDLIWLHPETTPLGPRERFRAKVLFGLCARAADRILAISEATKTDLVETLGFDPGKIDVTPLAVSEHLVEPTPEAELRQRLGLDGAPFVLTVAQKQPHKNLGALIQAMSDVDGAGLVLAGESEAHEQELRALADRLGVEGRVRFVDWVSDADLQGLYRSATCFVLPSLIEGFGLPVLESMRHGTPVACSDRSALAEVADGAALLFDPDDQRAVTDAVHRLVDDEDLRADLAERGRKRCDEFSWERTAKETLAAYRRAIEVRQ